jgi:hypothetical protein
VYALDVELSDRLAGFVGFSGGVDGRSDNRRPVHLVTALNNSSMDKRHLSALKSAVQLLEQVKGV